MLLFLLSLMLMFAEPDLSTSTIVTAVAVGALGLVFACIARLFHWFIAGVVGAVFGFIIGGPILEFSPGLVFMSVVIGFVVGAMATLFVKILSSFGDLDDFDIDFDD